MARIVGNYVTPYVKNLRGLLDRARNIKPNGGIEPALKFTDFGVAIENIGKQSGSDFLAPNSSHYAGIETACREIFYSLLATTPIDDPAFSEVWNLLDITSILSDTEKCEPGLVFWLVEELLDTQTIDGCRIIFDYLDSRRERITAKHFKQKQLIILRACNELLRRLSRAEDTVFCGRVFIFMFQSFPLGDRSSVNLRGEYHVENVTTFEGSPDVPGSTQEGSSQKGSRAENVDSVNEVEISQATDTKDTTDVDSGQLDIARKSVAFEDDSTSSAAQPDMSTLYPVFWSLQANFSNPTRLFDDESFQEFKSGLQLTMMKLRSIHQDSQGRGASRPSDDNQRGTKRKQDDEGHDLSASFNPKYLTSRDLFELEVSDLAFRRHVLVQALILTDFLLSLTARAKKKLEDKTNKSVLYSYTLSEADIEWATQMKSDIATYLQQGPEGKFYYRMIDTVLTRDKNWTHWKADNCPLIERTSIPAEEFMEAQQGAQRACANKRLKATPLGSLDLNFLSDPRNGDGFIQLTELERYSIPAVDAFKGPIADDDFDISTAQTDEQKQQATDARASKLWRTLRVASKSRLNLLDKIDDGNNLQALFDPTGSENHASTENDGGPTLSEDTKEVEEGKDMGHEDMDVQNKENEVTVELDVNGGNPTEKDHMSLDTAQKDTTVTKSSEIPPQQDIVE